MTKSISKIVSSIYIAGIIAVIGSNVYAQNKQRMQEDVAQAQKNVAKVTIDYWAEVANYKKIAAEKIALNDKSALEFKARMALEKPEVKADYKMKIAVLELKNNDMKKRLEDSNADNKVQWEKFKTEFNHDMDELVNAFKDLTAGNTK